MGAVLVYAINDMQSFRDLDEWVENLKSNCDPLCSAILLGNKTDTAETERQVSFEMGSAFARLHGLQFFEVSALKDIATVE